MQPVEIKKDIFWVGFVDYDHRDFHGYSRSPDGSTYNAYLIKDEKNVLLDTVASGCEGTLLCRAETALAQHEAADLALPGVDREGLVEGVIETALLRVIGSGRARIAHHPINPSTGDDAEA